MFGDFAVLLAGGDPRRDAGRLVERQFVVVISDKEFFYVRGVHVFSAFYITDYSKTKVPKRKPQNFNFFYSGESKSEFLLISHHARTEKDIRHLLAEPVGRR